MRNNQHPREDVEEISFASSESRQPRLAPADYRPKMDTSRVVYDDELDQLEPDAPWRTFFSGGSNGFHLVAGGPAGEAHFVDQAGLDGRYRATGPGYYREFDHANDALYYAEGRMQGKDEPRAAN